MEKEMNQNTPQQPKKPEAPKAPQAPKPAQNAANKPAKDPRGVDLTAEAWRDLIFEGKNKDFGAYELRSKSDNRHTLAFIWTIVLICSFALAVFIWTLYNDYRLEQERIAREQAEQMMAASINDNEEPMPEEDEPDQKYEEPEVEVREEQIAQVQATQIAIVEKAKEDLKVQNQDDLKETDAAISNKNEEGDTKANLDNLKKDLGPAPEPKQEAPKEKPQEIFKAVEQMPQFPGGQAALMSWLSKNIRYPQTALQNGTEGRVAVQFVVEKDGSIGQVTVVKSVDKDLDREAVRVVKSMPKWQPGKNNGQPVRCYYTLPVTFKIQQQ